MAVTIRLSRAGGRKDPYYHVVATDSRKARCGRYLEKIGRYDPKPNPVRFEIQRDRLEHWLKAGATTSRTVAQLLAQNPEPAAEAKAE